MVKHRMDLLELLRKRGIDGDVDFLREALQVLVYGGPYPYIWLDGLTQTGA